MPSLLTSRTRLLLALLLVAVVLSLPGPGGAQECMAVDANDFTRSCTFMEELGQCLTNSNTSYAQCVDGRWIMVPPCLAGKTVDDIACLMSGPVTYLFPS